MTDIARENQASAPVRGGLPRRIVIGAALFALVLAGAEATVRLDDSLRWGMPFFATDTSISDLAVSDVTGRHPESGRTFRKWHINAAGTRGPEPDPSRAAARVLILGASETFGLYESPGQEYVRQLADTLAGAGCAADALNAGYPGMSLPTVEQDFRLRLAALKPRVTVYYPTPVQYVDDVVPRAVRPDSSGRLVKRDPWHSRFAIRARQAFKAMLPRYVLDRMRQRETSRLRRSIPGDSIFAGFPSERLAAFDRDLRRLVGTIHGSGSIPVLATHANAFVGAPPAAQDRLRAWERFYPRATGAMLLAFDSAAAESVRRVAADSGIAVIDPWRAFHDAPGELMFADFSHFTDAGAAKMAGILRPAVVQALGCAAGSGGATPPPS